MGKTKKAFIDRKNAVTFRLVHRSQHDPLITDEAAPQHVLVEAGVRQPQKSNDLEVDAAQRKIEQRKYGIHFDDDYNYLQHLKKPEQQIVWEYMENPNQVKKRIEKGDLTTAPKLFLPSSVFATEYEEEEGMLNKAAPQPGPHPEWDPDVIACLDGDFDFDNEDNQLEDDFVMKAMNDDDFDETETTQQVGNEDISNFDEDCSTDEENRSDLDDVEDEMELLNKFNGQEFRNEETKSRFTEYSMSSSILPRNEQLRLLDDRFERFYATYDDCELGDLSTEDIQGHWSQNYPYIEGCMLLTKKPEEDIKYDKKWDKKRLKKYRFVSVDETLDTINDECIEMEVADPNEKKWDCESILSTYSNLYNHPKVIDETKGKLTRKLIKNLPQTSDKINIDTKSGIPTDVLRRDNNLNAKTLANLDNNNSIISNPQALCAKSLISTLSVLSIRPKDELPEEKRERKRLIKEYRNERRIERKNNTMAFKEEKKRQIQIKINQRLNQNGTKIL